MLSGRRVEIGAANGRNHTVSPMVHLADHTRQISIAASDRYAGLVKVEPCPPGSAPQEIYAAFERLLRARRLNSGLYARWLSEAIAVTAESDPGLTSVRQLALAAESCFSQWVDAEDEIANLKASGIALTGQGPKADSLKWAKDKAIRQWAKAERTLATDPNRAMNMLFGAIKEAPDDVLEQPDLVAMIHGFFASATEERPASGRRALLRTILIAGEDFVDVRDAGEEPERRARALVFSERCNLASKAIFSLSHSPFAAAECGRLAKSAREALSTHEEEATRSAA